MKQTKLYKLSILFLLIILITQSKPIYAQSPDQVEEILAQMTVEEKVGQVFLVSFMGTADDWAVQSLINDLKIGNLVVSAINNNFSNTDDLPDSLQVAKLSNSLQTLAWQNQSNNTTHPPTTFLPLLLAVDHEGNGLPLTGIRTGMTAIPSQLSVGATWRTDHAQAVGHIVGQELASIGVNMILGPVVDVVDEIPTGIDGNMAWRVFGGDPEWVGKMGRAYIAGIHQGSNGQVATVAKHFPGHGNSVRNPDDVPTYLSHTLTDLEQLDLIPFFMIAQANTTTNNGQADAIMSSHIAYKRETATGLISLTQEDGEGAITKLLAHPAFNGWQNNGLVVSDSLGVRAVKTYYDPTLQYFPHRLIAYDALMAGNDLLILANYAIDGRFSTAYQNISDTVWYFQQLYQTAPHFQTRLDDAVRKIISLKLKMYPNPSLETTLVDETLVSNPEQLKQNAQAIYTLAQDAVTLLHPSSITQLPPPPQAEQQILIATHNFPNINPKLPINKLQGLIEIQPHLNPTNIHTLPFFRTYQQAGLISFLNRADSLTSAEETYINELINNADWIIFALLDQDWGPSPAYIPNIGRYHEANTLKTFLDKYTGQAKIAVITFGVPPITLTPTDISKIDAYYGLYSYIDPFPEIAIKALFQQITPHTLAPLPVAGTTYNLNQQAKLKLTATPELEPMLTNTALPNLSVTPTSTPLPSNTPRPTFTLSPTPSPSNTPRSTFTATVTQISQPKVEQREVEQPLLAFKAVATALPASVTLTPISNIAEPVNELKVEQKPPNNKLDRFFISVLFLVNMGIVSGVGIYRYFKKA